jgi:ubiquinone/menaquinone biosynthesis C-methylase UbiE
MVVSARSAPAGINATFWDLVCSEPLRDVGVLDIGTGTGRVALSLAPLCRWVVGVDREADAIAEARSRAEALALVNVDFLAADADAVDYRALTPAVPALVTAHMFLSDALVERSARALPPGGALVMIGFHVDQWKETGRPSRFAYDEDRMRRVVQGAGFTIEHLSVEQDVRTFRTVEEALAAAINLQERWKSDGRWVRYLRFLEDGGRTLTYSSLIVKARRGSSAAPA